jgi:hypothetical protein
VKTKSLLLPCCTAALVAAFLWWSHPPIYSPEGYEYFQGAYDPIGALNAHHLLWEPLLGVVVRLAHLLRLNPAAAVQAFGVLCISLSALITFLLVERLKLSRWLTALGCVFIFLTPQVWYFSTQNQPYTLLILLTAISLGILGRKDEISLTHLLVAAGLLSLCVGLQQATVLWIPALGVYLWSAFPGAKGIQRTILWVAASATMIGLFYAGGAWSQGVHSLSRLIDWLTEYTRTEHGLQTNLWEILVQSPVGIIRTFIQTEGLEARLMAHYSTSAIAGMYNLCFWALIGTAFLIRKFSGSKGLIANQDQQLFRLSTTLLCGWSVFCLLWEPTNYYWAVGVVPFACFIVLLFREWMNAHKIACGVLLLAGIAWNVTQNRRLDCYYGEGAPDRIVPFLLHRLSNTDRFMTISRERPRNVDYWLLSDLLSEQGRRNEINIVEDFLLKDSATEQWTEKAHRLFEATWRKGGRIYITSDLQNLYAYDLVGGMLSSYKEQKYQRWDKNAVFVSVQEFLEGYSLTPSDLQLGADKFIELKPKTTSAR